MKNILKTKIKLPLISSIVSSFKSITWPTAKELLKNLLAVIIISAIIGAYLWILDNSFGDLRNWVLFK